jgi:hypothetical protein
VVALFSEAIGTFRARATARRQLRTRSAGKSCKTTVPERDKQRTRPEERHLRSAAPADADRLQPARFFPKSAQREFLRAGARWRRHTQQTVVCSPFSCAACQLSVRAAVCSRQNSVPTASIVTPRKKGRLAAHQSSGVHARCDAPAAHLRSMRKRTLVSCASHSLRKSPQVTIFWGSFFQKRRTPNRARVAEEPRSLRCILFGRTTKQQMPFPLMQAYRSVTAGAGLSRRSSLDQPRCYAHVDRLLSPFPWQCCKATTVSNQLVYVGLVFFNFQGRLVSFL